MKGIGQDCVDVVDESSCCEVRGCVRIQLRLSEPFGELAYDPPASSTGKHIGQFFHWFGTAWVG